MHAPIWVRLHVWLVVVIAFEVRKVPAEYEAKHRLFTPEPLLFGDTASDITGSGTNIDSIVKSFPLVNVSPDEHSMPNSATMSPASPECEARFNTVAQPSRAGPGRAKPS